MFNVFPQFPFFPMVKIGVYDAKTQLPSLLKRAQQGERIVITRRGVAVCELTPAKVKEAKAKAAKNPKAQERKAVVKNIKTKAAVQAKSVKITKKTVAKKPVAKKKEGGIFGGLFRK